MMPKTKLSRDASSTFKSAIAEASPPLNLKKGLQAIKKSEGGGQIFVKDGVQILGSVAIDDDCLKTYAQACRWDYVIGFSVASQPPRACYVEVHSAQTTHVRDVEGKLRWLRDTFLKQPTQTRLAAIRSEYVWVASGKNNIPRHTPEYKRLKTDLRKLGLTGPHKTFEVGSEPS